MWVLALVGMFTACTTDARDGDAPVAEVTLAQPPVGEGSSMPHLVSDGEGVLMSWLEPLDAGTPEGGWRVSTTRLLGGVWSAPQPVTESDEMFINWADFPSAVQSGNTTFAHWLQRGPDGGYDYSVNVRAHSEARSDAAPFVLHEDTAPVEHGFVSTVALPGDRIGVVWLDGRDFTGPDPHEMQVRYREVGPEGPLTAEVLLDRRACDCCQTDLAVSGDALLAVYRDRSDHEIRDISIVRNDGNGWSEPIRVHDDGWEIAGCPVNGPAISVANDQVAVAWFTAANDTPRVNVAFSQDGGRTFEPPIQVDAGAPVGRVDVEFVPGAEGVPSVAVSWIERTTADGGAELRTRLVEGHDAHPAKVVSTTTSARTSGFPQMVRVESDLLFAWTDTELNRIRVKRISTDMLR